jgi:hypothetical protein
MRRVAGTLAFGLHRVRADGARSVLVAAGVAAAGLLLAAVLLGSLVAQERALADSVEALAPSSRTVRAAWFGVPGQGDVYEDLDIRSRTALGSVTSGTPTATVLYRESSVEGRFVSLGAVDGLARWVRVTSGRLPATCTSEKCCSFGDGAWRPRDSSSSGAECSARQRCSATQWPRSATNSTVRDLLRASSASSATTSRRRRPCCSRKACGVWQLRTRSSGPTEATAG